jgi:hypothetical protein
MYGDKNSIVNWVDKTKSSSYLKLNSKCIIINRKV